MLLYTTLPGAIQSSASIHVPIAACVHVNQVHDADGRAYVPVRARQRGGVFCMEFRRPGSVDARSAHGECAYCGIVTRLTKDHAIPRCRLATLRGNTVLACAFCNCRKGGRGIGEWLLDELRSTATFAQRQWARGLLARVQRWMRPGRLRDEVLTEWRAHAARIARLANGRAEV